MILLKELLVELGACNEAQLWVGDKAIEEVVETCPRGDWALWLASKLKIDLQTLTLAKALCAKTVIHLMKDQRSIDAINIAEKFGRGQATREELDAAAAAAYYAADVAYDAAYANKAKRVNQLQTANICREILGAHIIEKINQLLTK
jgi:hypothetical protein